MLFRYFAFILSYYYSVIVIVSVIPVISVISA